MINVTELKEFLGCDEEFIFQLMEKFIVETKEGLQNLKSYAKEENWHSVKLIAHKMLSSTRIFKMEEMSVLLEKIEIMAENKVNVDQIPLLVSEFEAEWKKSIDEMNRMITRH